MNIFRLWTRRDPMVAVLRPYVDPREGSYLTKLNDAALEREWRRRLAENKARRESAKVDEIATHYAEDLYSRILQRQAG